ncbi:MAG: hypothetical protein ACOC2C_05750, partial [Cyclonatronaceae bacterium]
MNGNSSSDSSTSSQPGGGSRPASKQSKAWIALAVIVLFLGFFRLALKSDWAFELLRGQAEQMLSETLGADGEQISVEIDSMSGDLLEFIELDGLRIYRQAGSPDSPGQATPAVSLEHLRVDYALLALIYKRIEVRNLELRGLDVMARKERGEAWNLMALLPPPAPEPQETEEETPFDYAIELKKFSLSESRIQVFAPEYLPDGRLSVEDLQAAASFYFFAPDDELRAGLDELEFSVQEGRLPEALDVATSAGFDQDTITLHRLALSTGRSLLEAEARHALDGSDTEAELRIPELSRADLAAYLDELPEFETLSLQARATGDFSELEIRLEAQADRLAQLVMGAALEISPELLLRSAFLEIDELNAGALLKDESLGSKLSAGRFEARLEGRIPFEAYESANAELRIELGTSRFEALELSSLIADFSLQEGRLESRAVLDFPQEQQLEIDLAATGIWQEAPAWELRVETQKEGLNPAYFADDEALSGRVPFQLTASGTGLEPPAAGSEESELWRFDLKLPEPEIEVFEATERITLNGNLNAREVEADLDFRSHGGAGLTLSAGAERWHE